MNCNAITLYMCAGSLGSISRYAFAFTEAPVLPDGVSFALLTRNPGLKISLPNTHALKVKVKEIKA